MKRKILSLILVLMLLPVASLFSACGKDGYNLDNLQTEFNSIETENENIKNVNGKFVFDYSNHTNLKSVVEYVYPYTELENYNQVYENIMAFSFEYVDECSSNSVTSNANIKNNIKSDLDELKKAIHGVDSYVNMLAEIINVSYNDDIYTIACLTRYENLLIAYDELYRCAINFNNSLSDLYFNHVLIDGNPNIYEIDSSDFDVNVVINNFDARLKYQLSNLSECFVEMYISNSDLATKIVNGEDSFDLDNFNYQSNVEAINFAFDEGVAQTKAINNKLKYYELSIQAYNCQVALENDSSKFEHARNSISYASLDIDEATANEKLCVEIIEARFELVSIYNDVLTKMLAITKS